MHVYTIQQILDVRFLYKEAPYPGFSLEEACRRKRLTQTKLVRGDNAWRMRGLAGTTKEWVERHVQGILNKVTTSNFESMMEKLLNDVIFSTEETMGITVSLISKKALEEPESSDLYARVCYRLAEFEVSLTTAEQQTKGRKHSKFRNAVVSIAQEVFQSRRKTPSLEGLAEEETEQRLSAFMRRHRANMKFVGELFIYKVLSHNTMMSIIQTIMQEAEKGGYPTSDDIEFLTELLCTIGESLDAIPELRVRMDVYFKLLGDLKEQKEVYPPRIRFKLLDLIELRHKFKWERRAVVVPKVSSSTQREPLRVTDKFPTRSAASLKTTSPSAGGAKKGKHGIVSKLASNQPALGTAAANTASGAVAGRSWSNVVKTTDSSGDVGVLREAEPVLFEARVRSLFYEWVAECTNDFIPEWMNEFGPCQRTFDSEEEFCKHVAKEVVREACMTTKKEAQREASSFLVVGLYMADVEVFDGFAMALASAIEEGVLEDVPKFSERFINMLRITSGENDVADVYYDTARVLCTAYRMIPEPDAAVLDTLMGFWGKIPRPAEGEHVVLPLPVVQSLVEMSADGQAPLVGRVIASLHTIGLLDDETVAQWLSMPLEGNAADVAEAFRNAEK